MPVSHLGLTVAHIPSALSFYLAALQPLDYGYMGQRGDSVGLGIHDADFFLTQSRPGHRPATQQHIAFNARDRTAVRQCYTAALNAGGRPSGAPGYREDDCGCFNAAVEDPDGNTVEFIWRDTTPKRHAVRPAQGQARSVFSQSRPMPIRSQTSRAPDNDISDPRSGGLQRSRTEPIASMSPGGLLGVAFGAFAGAAVGYAMFKSEKDGAREEAYYSSYVLRGRPDDQRERSSRRSASAAGSSRSYRDGNRADTRVSARAAPVIDGVDPPAIEYKPYRDDADIAYVRTKVTRQSSGRNKTYEAIEYEPSRVSTRRAVTMPIERLDDEISRHSSRRGSVPDTRPHRRDSVVSGATSRSYMTSKSHRTQEPAPRSSASQASTVKPARRDSTRYAESAARVPLPPSVASRTSSRVSVSRPAGSSRHDAWYLPADEDDDDDGLGDTATIVPDDSISCIDLPRPRRSSAREHNGRRGSTMTIPARATRDDRTRSRIAYSNA